MVHVTIVIIFDISVQLNPGPVYIVGFGLVEMGISTNPKPTIYCSLYENTGPDGHLDQSEAYDLS